MTVAISLLPLNLPEYKIFADFSFRAAFAIFLDKTS
jgi:hypothetical protein